MTFNFEFNESSTDFPIYFPDTIVGPKGDKGDKGDTGPQGPQGEQGPIGPSGPTKVVVGGVEQSTVTFTSDPQTQIDGKQDTMSEGSGIDITNDTVGLDINSLESTTATSTSDVVPIYRNNSIETGNKKLTLSKIADFVKSARNLINTSELDNALIAKISNPASKSDGQVLTYDADDDEWKALDPSGGSEHIFKTGTSSEFSLESPASVNDYPYRASVTDDYVTSSDKVYVEYNFTQINAGIYAPITSSYNGGFYIYASESHSAETVAYTIFKS